MSDFTRAALAFLTSFFVGMVIAPIIIKGLKRLKAGQKILNYVDQHKEKEGIPTMGGIIFLLSATAGAFAFGAYKSNLALVFIAITFAYGVVGFLDDFLKVKLKRNLGLKAYQKIIAQVAVAAIAAAYCAKSPYVGTAIDLPFTDKVFEMGWWYVPFAMVTFLALSNAVNLTDGLDGLAGTTSAVYFSAFLAIIAITLAGAYENGATLYAAELLPLCVTIAALIGGLLAVLWFNSNKASVFMGDTGSLALGGAAGAAALFSKNPLISILIGCVFVFGCLSVIIQVISFKLRGKRVFLMSPFHHHLELKGWNESKIVGFYGIVTAAASVVALVIY